jgi:hypothetical protein
MTPLFLGRVLPGGLLVLDRPKDYARAVRALAGSFIEVTIRKQRTQRSLDQNAYLHSVPFPLLAAHFGESVEGIKYALMGEKWGWKTSPLNPFQQVPVRPHSSSMTVAEASEFIEWLVSWAMTEHGVSIPLPGEVAA